VLKAGKHNEFHIGFVGELHPHFLVDIQIFLPPNDRHGRGELVQIGLKIVLVPREVCIVMSEGIRRRDVQDLVGFALSRSSVQKPLGRH
jgi:hypothetical protein